jgi:hypothetical protein
VASVPLEIDQGPQPKSDISLCQKIAHRVFSIGSVPTLKSGLLRMKSAVLLLLLAILATDAQAQNPTPAPKKNPFEGWGTELDKRPGGHSPSTSLDGPGKAPASPFKTPGPASARPPASGGIVLSANADSPLAISSGGHSLEIRDISAVLSKYGTAVDDEGPHPEVTVYPGTTYLMPFDQAEKILVTSNPGMRSATPIATGGFPPGLLAVSYDGNWGGNYNRLYLVKDRANQLVCLEFVSERGGFNPLQPPATLIPGDWHVIDFINARVKGQPRMQILNYVKDMRSAGHFIIVNTLSQAMHQTSTWYVPEPLINLILFSASKSSAR